MLGNMVDGSCSLFGAGFFSEFEVMRTDRLACQPLEHPRHPRLQHASSRARVVDLYGFLGLLHVPGLYVLSFVGFHVKLVHQLGPYMMNLYSGSNAKVYV